MPLPSAPITRILQRTSTDTFSQVLGLLQEQWYCLKERMYE
jgi:hypothetical protein